jgi:hypothetical protein
LQFRFEPEGTLPEVVRADEKRAAPDFDQPAGQRHQVHCQWSRHLCGFVMAREMALLEIDTTPAPVMTPADELASVFEPFERGSQTGQSATGQRRLGRCGSGFDDLPKC